MIPCLSNPPRRGRPKQKDSVWRAHGERITRNPNSEFPKSERTPNSEFRNRLLRCAGTTRGTKSIELGISGFRDFLRTSDFGLRTSGLTLLTLLSVLLLPAPTVRSASVSANYSIVHHSLGGGGGRAQSARYTVHAATAGLGDSSSHGAAGLSNVSGFPGQITDEPAALDASYEVALNGSVAITLTATDPENDPLTFQVLSNPAHGTLTGTPPNLTYQAGASFATFDQFTFVVHDGTFQSAPATITLVAPGANAPPTITPISNQFVTEGQLLSRQVIASDPNQPTQSLTFSLGAGSPFGAAIETTTGLFTWTPTESQGPGVYDLTVIVTDNASTPLQATAQFRVTVAEANQSPTLVAIADISVAVGTLATFTAVASDADLPAQQLQFSLGPDAPVGAHIDPVTGAFTWTPGASAAGNQFSVTITVTDNGTPLLSASRTFTISVTGAPPPPANTAPTLEPIPDRTVEANTLLSFTAAASDTDQPPQQLQFSLGPGAPSGAQINPTTGLFTWTPGSDAAGSQFSITIFVTDNGSPALSASRTFTITVTTPPPPPPANTAPSLAAIADRSVTAGTTLSVIASANDGDQPPQQLIFTLGAGAPPGAQINPLTGLFTWTPSATAAGDQFSVTVIVIDNGSPALSASRTFTITVTSPPPPPPINTAPTLAAIADQSAQVGNPLTFQVSATDAESPPQQLTFSLGSGAPAGVALDSNTGLFAWTPGPETADQRFVLTVIATDNGSPPLSASQTFNITVAAAPPPPQNTPPILASIENRIIEEGRTLDFPVLAADRDVPAQKLSYTLEPGAPEGARLDIETLTFSWTPAENQGPGSYRITVRATDDGEPPLSDVRSFTVTVSEVNLPPVLAPINDQNARAGETLTFTATAIDPDLPAQTLTFGLVEGPAGATIDPATGRFVWTPPASQPVGPVLVQITVRDNGSPAASAAESVRIDIVAGLRLLIPGRVSETEFQLGLQGPPDACYRIEASTDLVHWTPAVSGAADASGRFTFTDPRAPSVIAKYYRAIEIPCVPPPAMPRILQPTLTSQNEIQFTIEGAPGACYRVESTTDFQRWTSVLSGSADTTGHFVAIARRDPIMRAAFYRVVAISCAAAPPVEISPPKVTTSGEISFSIRGAPNSCYTLEATSDLLTWQQVSEQKTDAAGAAEITTTIDRTLGFAFFRARPGECAGP